MHDAASAATAGSVTSVAIAAANNAMQAFIVHP
jgi:hypothetical protein